MLRNKNCNKIFHSEILNGKEKNSQRFSEPRGK